MHGLTTLAFVEALLSALCTGVLIGVVAEQDQSSVEQLALVAALSIVTMADVAFRDHSRRQALTAAAGSTAALVLALTTVMEIVALFCFVGWAGAFLQAIYAPESRDVPLEPLGVYLLLNGVANIAHALLLYRGSDLGKPWSVLCLPYLLLRTLLESLFGLLVLCDIRAYVVDGESTQWWQDLRNRAERFAKEQAPDGELADLTAWRLLQELARRFCYSVLRATPQFLMQLVPGMFIVGHLVIGSWLTWGVLVDSPVLIALMAMGSAAAPLIPLPVLALLTVALFFFASHCEHEQDVKRVTGNVVRRTWSELCRVSTRKCAWLLRLGATWSLIVVLFLVGQRVGLPAFVVGFQLLVALVFVWATFISLRPVGSDGAKS